MFDRYRGTRRRTDPLSGLNDQQREAATALDGALLVLAGAGTGKTKTLTARIAHLIAQQRARPYQVLALTFTNDAAEVMKDRLSEMIGEERASQIWVGTFHSIARRLLAERPWLAGLAKGFEIADAAQSRRAVRIAMEDAGIEGHDDRDAVQAAAAAIATMKDEGITPDEASVAGWIGTKYGGDEVPEDVATAAQVYAAYQAILREDNLADFGDLLLWVVKALEGDESYRRDVAGRFRYIHIDEYQDTNVQQALFVHLLGRDHRNVCAVGDDSQSLYAWRGADVGNILGFPDQWTPCRMVRLEINYRSTPVILACANAVIANNKRRFAKTLRPDPARRDGGPPVRVVGAESLEDAADWLADDIRLRRAECDDEPGTLVLYRANWLSRVVEEALIDADLPYTVVGDVGFWGRLEVRDALAYLALAVNPADADAWERIANFPPRGLGDVAMERIRAAAGAGDLVQAGRRLADAGMLRGVQASGARALADAMAGWRDTASSGGFADRLQRLLDATGYEEHWRAADDPRADERLDNVAELLQVAREVGSAAALHERAERAAQAERDDAPVRLMTVHAAKGLEDDEAYLFGVDEGIFPSAHAVRAEMHDGGRGIEEERNGMYVGMTRPHERLTVVHTSTAPSRFIDEIPGQETLRIEGRSWSRMRRRRPSADALAAARTLARTRRRSIPAAALNDAALLAAWTCEANSAAPAEP
ncbi:ATP-dependent helicase (plasmid) [Azospirillum argentinense]|uniref:DNA 3'-5' helicase n=1 Tax=Azospirillum argentinense TaxID=2970906 RepID=A0A4D8PQ30_9PROT|nr:ATP-dependent helicase [Azospirillum argentinense]QCO00037.1 ATP-dependent helicase [Azospirillum argentinense]